MGLSGSSQPKEAALSLRFLSKYPGYKIPGVHQETERLADGTVRVLAEGYMCEFTHGGLTDADREFARTRFVWKGVPTALDGSQLDPILDLKRVGVFDTADVPETLRARVEQALLANTAFGQDYVLVETVKLEAPYALYDKHRSTRGQRTLQHAIRDITAAYETAGFDVPAAVAYERQNGNDPEVIAALEQLAGAPEPDGELVTA